MTPPETAPAAAAPAVAWIDSGSPCPHPWSPAVCPVCSPWTEGAAEPFDRAGAQTAQLTAAQVLQALPAEASKIVLRGGELLQRPEALELLTAARRIAPQVELWSNGAALARPGVVQAIRRAGATAVAIGLWGDSPESHDYATGVPGSFARAIAGLKAARQGGLRTAVIAVLLRPTYRGLPSLLQKSLPLGIDAALLWAPPGPDRTAHPLLAPMAAIGPYVDAGVRILAAAGKGCAVLGIAPCALATAAAAAEISPLAQPDRRAARGAPCAACTWRDHCAGQPPLRAQLHGWTGLVARKDAPVLTGRW